MHAGWMVVAVFVCGGADRSISASWSHAQAEWGRGANDITTHHSSHHSLLRESRTLSEVTLQGLGAKLCCNGDQFGMEHYYLLDYIKYSLKYPCVKSFRDLILVNEGHTSMIRQDWCILFRWCQDIHVWQIDAQAGCKSDVMVPCWTQWGNEGWII